AKTSTAPRLGGPLADGRTFIRFLAVQRTLPDPGKLEALWVDLRYRTIRDGLVPRRGGAIKFALLGQSRLLVISLSLPWLGAPQHVAPFLAGCGGGRVPPVGAHKKVFSFVDNPPPPQPPPDSPHQSPLRPTPPPRPPRSTARDPAPPPDARLL